MIGPFERTLAFRYLRGADTVGSKRDVDEHGASRDGTVDERSDILLNRLEAARHLDSGVALFAVVRTDLHIDCVRRPAASSMAEAGHTVHLQTLGYAAGAAAGNITAPAVVAFRRQAYG